MKSPSNTLAFLCETSHMPKVTVDAVGLLHLDNDYCMTWGVLRLSQNGN